MILRENGSWHVIYQACRKIWWTGFLARRNDYKYYSTDLCTFVRTIFVWTPLALAVNLWTIFVAIFAIGDLVYMLWLRMTIVGIILAVIVGIVLAGGLCFLVVLAGRKMLDVLVDSESLSIAMEWADAKKKEICPLITFSRTGSGK